MTAIRNFNAIQNPMFHHVLDALMFIMLMSWSVLMFAYIYKTLA